ncbi:MAG: hypothetical protein KJO96_06020 [Winogradskyella sp.]|nr:hypothetical protein [Winogradskyella sp.]
MSTFNTNPKMVEWLNADEMHDASKKWLSELEFVADEQLFFDDLIKSYTLQLIDSKYFNKSQSIIEALKKIKKRNNLLIEAIKTHESELKIMVDGVDDLPNEERYKKEHRNLIIVVSDFLKDYKVFKTEFFALIKKVIKEAKQKRLLE